MQTEALFEKIAERLQQEITQAKQSIYIAVAWFTNQQLFNALLEKANDGCKVVLLVSNDAINQASSIDYELLNIHKSRSYMIGDGTSDLMHHKFCVIDYHTVITGSYNWSYKAASNKENIVITIGDTALVEQFIHEFNNIRKAYFPEESETVVVLPMHQILKRFEILKNYIILEELDELDRVITKLKKFDFNQDVSNIISDVENQNFVEAISKIQTFITVHNQIAIWTDPELAALKLEIKSLENQLNAFSNEKIELEKHIAEFEHRYTIELGTVILKILELKKILFKEDEAQYEEAKRQEEQFYEQVVAENKKQIYDLSDEQKTTLKKKFRQASHLCHPDKVSSEFTPQATKVFMELKKAYDTNDLKKVAEILEDLEQGHAFTNRSDALSDKKQLKATIEKLRLQIQDLEEAIITIKESETYQTIVGIEDWDEYFADLKEQLEEQLEVLKSSTNPTELS